MRVLLKKKSLIKRLEKGKRNQGVLLDLYKSRMGSEEEGSGDDTGGGGEGGSTDQLEVISLDVSKGFGGCYITRSSPD